MSHPTPPAVTGFHGTSTAAAAEIARSGFSASQNEYDWLGDGIYFWQDAPLRARSWAEQRFPGEWAVVRATIDLRDCMDLLDPRWHERLRRAHRLLVQRFERLGTRLPRQSPGAHRLDRAVVNYLVGELAIEGVTIRSVRAAFGEGDPLYEDSALQSLAHVQIAVLDPRVILDKEVLRW